MVTNEVSCMVEFKNILGKPLNKRMLIAASALDFEKAAKLRDQLFVIRGDTPMDKHQPSRRRKEKMRKAEH